MNVVNFIRVKMEFFTHSSNSTPIWRRGLYFSLEFMFSVVLFLCIIPASLGDHAKAHKQPVYSKLKTEVNGVPITEDNYAGTYGQGTKINKDGPIRGQLVHVQNHLGCRPVDPDIVPSRPWIALVSRGECNFSDKIHYAAKASNASAVIIYNSKDSTDDDIEKYIFMADSTEFNGRYQLLYLYRGVNSK